MSRAAIRDQSNFSSCTLWDFPSRFNANQLLHSCVQAAAKRFERANKMPHIAQKNKKEDKMRMETKFVLKFHLTNCTALES